MRSGARTAETQLKNISRRLGSFVGAGNFDLGIADQEFPLFHHAAAAYPAPHHNTTAGRTNKSIKVCVWRCSKLHRVGKKNVVGKAGLRARNGILIKCPLRKAIF